MIEAIVIVIGFVLFTSKMFEKFHVWDDFLRYGRNAKFEWLHELTKCRFCILFHIGWMFTLFYGSMTSFSWPLLIVPVVVGGFISITTKE